MRSGTGGWRAVQARVERAISTGSGHRRSASLASFAFDDFLRFQQFGASAFAQKQIPKPVKRIGFWDSFVTGRRLTRPSAFFDTRAIAHGWLLRDSREELRNS